MRSAADSPSPKRYIEAIQHGSSEAAGGENPNPTDRRRHSLRRRRRPTCLRRRPLRPSDEATSIPSCTLSASPQIEALPQFFFPSSGDLLYSVWSLADWPEKAGEEGGRWVGIGPETQCGQDLPRENCIDSIGGVRVPGGYCGVLAFRPSHGVVPNSGVIPVAPSLDTIGWFARDPTVLCRVGHLLLRLPYADIRQPRHFYIADDCFELSKLPARRLTQVVTKSVEKLFGRQVLSHVNLENYLASRIPSLRSYSNGHKNGYSKFSSLLALSSAMQLLHKHEFKDQHMEWINLVKPAVDACIINDLSDDGDSTIDSCQDARTEVRLALNALLKDDGILVIPTALGCPPKLNSRELSSASYNTWTLCLSSLSSMSGCCQVTIPLGTHDKFPISVSFIARHGGERFLLDTTQTIYATIQEQVEILAKSNVSSKQAMNEEAAEAAKEKGNIAFKEKQWQKAINFYTEAIKLNGKVATFYSNRAAAFLELTSYRQAEADCTSAIDIDPKSVKAYLRRGTAREMLGYYKEAVDDFSYALVLEPMNKTAGVAINRIKKLFP